MLTSLFSWHLANTRLKPILAAWTRRAQQVFADWQVRAGLDRRHTFHRLRHTAVNQVYRATKDILLTQRFARHSSVLVTSVYLNPTDEDLARSVRRIPC